MNSISKNFTLGTALALLFTLSLGTAVASDEATYKMAHEDAVAALDMAASVGSEWRDARWKRSKAVKVQVNGETKRMSYLHAAEAYAKMGDWENAVKYAEIARFQGMAGYQQGVGQQNAAPQF